MQWSNYNQYVNLVTSSVDTYEVVRTVYYESTGQYGWRIYTTNKDINNQPIGLWRTPEGEYIGEYAGTVLDRTMIEAFILEWETTHGPVVYTPVIITPNIGNDNTPLDLDPDSAPSI
jgi:hypothetical protein